MTAELRYRIVGADASYTLDELLEQSHGEREPERIGDLLWPDQVARLRQMRAGDSGSFDLGRTRVCDPGQPPAHVVHVACEAGEDETWTPGIPALKRRVRELESYTAQLLNQRDEALARRDEHALQASLRLSAAVGASQAVIDAAEALVDAIEADDGAELNELLAAYHEAYAARMRVVDDDCNEERAS